jgi:hypothetical protein
MRPRRFTKPLTEPTLGQLALAEIKRREEEEAPLGGWGGEMIVPPAEPHTTRVEPARLGIPPPDWDEEERLRRERDAPPEPALDEELPGSQPPTREPA